MFDRMTPAAFEMLNTVFNCGYAVREDAAKNQFFVAISPAGNYVITLNLHKVGRDFCKRSFTVPAQLFEDEQVFNVFAKQVFVMDRDTNEDRSARSRELLHTHEFFTGFYGDKESKDVLELFGKIAYMASSNWTSIMDTVETCIGYDCNRYLHFVPGVIVSLLDPVADATASDLKLVYKHIIKESLAIDGYMPRSVEDCVFHITRDGNQYMNEAPKKAIARYSKLSKTPTATSIGRKAVFVCAYVPEGLHEWLFLGNTLCSEALIRQYGTFRCVSKDGLKCMTSIAPEGYMPEGVDMIACSNSYKSGLNGIAYHALFEMFGNDSDVFTALAHLDVDQITEIANTRRTTVQFGDYQLDGYLIYPELNVTTFNMLSGLNSIDGDTSVYQDALQLIAEDPTFNLVEYVYNLEQGGLVKYKSPRVNIKSTTLEVVYWSYGEEVATKYMQTVFARMMGLPLDKPELWTGVDINDFMKLEEFDESSVDDCTHL